VQNLNNLLNTRKGFGSVLPDLGIRDMNEYCSRAHIAEAIVKEVKQNIECYEPRVLLNDIILMDDDNPLRLSFRIDCTLRHTSQSLRMVFDSMSSRFALDRL
jgi:type VI secretion system protein